MEAEASEPSDGAVAAGDPYEAFWRALDEFVRALRHARGRAAANTPAGELTISQYKLLDAAVGAEAPRIGELAVEIGASAPTVTRMIGGLERAGLIERHASDEDRRAVRIELTDEGRAARLRTKRRLDAKRRRLFEALPADQREQAVRVLRSMAEGIDAL